jgi:hypothetical protein
MTRSIAVLAALSLFGCHQLEGGPEVSEARTLDAFTRVRIEDGIPAKLSPGTPQATINAPEKVVANLTTVVKDGTLVVSLKPNVIVSSMEGTEVLITGQAVVAVEASGASTLTVTGVDQSPFRGTASGASQLTLSGSSADLRLNASGASTISAAELTATVATADASGASTIELNASKSVEGSASGASHITVSGGADLSGLSASGASIVTAAN